MTCVVTVVGSRSWASIGRSSWMGGVWTKVKVKRADREADASSPDLTYRQSAPMTWTRSWALRSSFKLLVRWACWPPQTGTPHLRHTVHATAPPIASVTMHDLQSKHQGNVFLSESRCHSFLVEELPMKFDRFSSYSSSTRGSLASTIRFILPVFVSPPRSISKLK